MQRGMISSLNDRGRVTDRPQSRFSQNQFTPSVFIITDPTIIKTSPVHGGTSWKFTMCFIYLCSNRSKRKKQNKQSCREERVSNLGRLRSFPFLSLCMRERRGEPFHFGTPTQCFGAQTGRPEPRSVKLLTFATGCYTADLPVVFWRGTDCDLRASRRHPCVTFRCRRGNSGASGIPARPTTQNRPRPFRWENSRG